MRIHTIEHVPFEGPGAIADFAAENGHGLTRTRIYAGDALPPVGGADLLVVMGGPMSVHDEAAIPWLGAEKAYLRRTVDAGARILGVCLGAQLLAEVLGGEVTRNREREIGWFPVRLTPDATRSSLFEEFPSEFPAFHWHGETFSLPPGAVWIARSEACAHQAFEALGRIVGLQFHLETTAESMEQLIANCSGEIEAGMAFVQSAREMRERVRMEYNARKHLNLLLTRMLS